MSLADNQAAFFEEHGYLNGLRVHDDANAAGVRQAFDQLEAREGKENCEIGLQGRHVDTSFIWELATNPIILDGIANLIGDDVMLLSTHFFCKYPRAEQKFVAWHQDVTYWGLEPPLAVTAWYAVDDSDRGNGCMRVIPGSHRDGIIEHGTSTRHGNLLSINQSIESDVGEDGAVDLELKSGEISIHHGLLVHGSNPNTSDRRRCGLTLRYCPPSVSPVRENSLRTPWPAFLVRGEDRFGNFPKRELQFQ